MFLVENWGSGLLRVQQSLNEAGLSSLEVQDFVSSLRFTVRRKAMGGNMGGDMGGNMLSDLPEQQRAVCEWMLKMPNISSSKLAENLHVSVKTIEKRIAVMRAKGVIERRGGTRGVWHVRWK